MKKLALLLMALFLCNSCLSWFISEEKAPELTTEQRIEALGKRREEIQAHNQKRLQALEQARQKEAERNKQQGQGVVRNFSRFQGRRITGAQYQYTSDEARRGNLDACYKMYIYLDRGMYGQADPETAMTWLRKAAAGGHVRAKQKLLLMGFRD